MKRFTVSAFRPLRMLVIVFACALIVLSNALPAFAMGRNKSKPSDGTIQLDKIEQRAEDMAQSDPLSLKETQSRTQGGLNEVQGSADKNKMKRPSNSQDATTIGDQLEGALEKVIGKD